jgi:hypothetical protein
LTPVKLRREVWAGSEAWTFGMLTFGHGIMILVAP